MSSLKVTTAATATRLTTAAKATDLPILTGKSEDDALALIDAASALIAEYLGVPGLDGSAPGLGVASVEETFRDVKTCRPIRAALAPIETVESIREGTQLLLSTDPDFRFDIDEASAIIRKLDQDNRETYWTSDLVTIAYTAGWRLPEESNRTLPAPIERGCLRLIARMQEMDNEQSQFTRRLKSKTIPGVGTWQWAVDALDNSGGLPPDVRSLLDPYRFFKL